MNKIKIGVWVFLAAAVIVVVLTWSVRHDARVMKATEGLCQIEDVDGKITVLPCSELTYSGPGVHYDK